MEKGCSSQVRAEFERDGFAIIRSVFSEAEINEVKKLASPLFDDFQSKQNGRIRDVGALGNTLAGTEQPEIDRTIKFEPKLTETTVYKKIQSIAAELLGRKAYYVFDHVICKSPQNHTETAWHQDRGYMKGNTELDTINFWVPFQDVDESNGTLSYIPGSHKSELVKHSSPEELHDHVLAAEVSNFDDQVITSLKKGDICFHHPLTLHGAGKNNTDEPRYAWSLHFGAYGRAEYFKPSNIARLIGSMFNH